MSTDGGHDDERPVVSLGFELRGARSAARVRGHGALVTAGSTRDAHVIVDSPEALRDLASAVAAAERVVVASDDQHLAVRISANGFAHVVDAAVAGPILDALRLTEVTAHDLVPLLARCSSCPERIFDTRIAAGLVHHATRVEEPQLDLANCVARFARVILGAAPNDFRGLVRETETVHRLRAVLETEVARLELAKTLDLEHFALPGLVDAVRTGLPIDRAGWSATLATQRARQEALHTSLARVLRTNDLENGRKVCFGLRSLGLDVRGTKAFELFPFNSEPVVADYLEYRRVTAFVNDLGPSVLQHLDADDRVRATYDPVGAATGRVSTRSPNVMGLPRTMRHFVQARPGHVFVDADYSAIELRIIAAKTKDPRLMQAFHEGLDVHRMTAALITGKAYDEITNEERHRAKPVNFGWVFGMSINGFIRNAIESYGITFTRDEATEIRARYFGAYAGIVEWHEMLRRHLDRKVVLATAGRARRVPAATENDRMLPFRILANSPVQGTAANGMKRALGLLARRLPAYDAHIVATVHDQVLVEVKEELAHEVKDLVVATMKEGMQHDIKSVPIEVEAAIKKSWGG